MTAKGVVLTRNRAVDAKAEVIVVTVSGTTNGAREATNADKTGPGVVRLK